MPSPTFESQSSRYPSGHRKRVAVMRWMVAAVLLFAGALVATGSSSSPVVAADATSSYVPIKPTRLVDTRSGSAVQANVARDFQITGAAVPANCDSGRVERHGDRVDRQRLPAGVPDRPGNAGVKLDAEPGLRRADHPERGVRPVGQRWQGVGVLDVHHPCVDRRVRLLRPGHHSNIGSSGVVDPDSHPGHPQRARMDTADDTSTNHTSATDPSAADAVDSAESGQLEELLVTSRRKRRPRPGSTRTSRSTATSPGSMPTVMAFRASRCHSHRR